MSVRLQERAHLGRRTVALAVEEHRLCASGLPGVVLRYTEGIIVSFKPAVAHEILPFSPIHTCAS